MARHAEDDGGEVGRKPEPEPTPSVAEEPTELLKTSWQTTFKRTAKEFKDHNLTDSAAALTYYGVLSISPAVLILVSIVGLVGTAAIRPLIDDVGGLVPGAVSEILGTILTQLQDRQGAAGIALVLGLVVALWAASGYVGAFMRTSNNIYGIGEGRPIWKTLSTRVAITLVVIVLLAAMAVGVVLTGPLARGVGGILGMGDTAITVWDIAKWPVLLLLFSVIIALLYWATPNVKRSFRWVSPGSLLAVGIWIIASVVFGLYVANFGNYDRTYGSLAAVVIFLVWLWISNIAILFGVEFNAELERARAIASGHPADEEPYVEPRDTRSL
jgi:membrane protein